MSATVLAWLALILGPLTGLAGIIYASRKTNRTQSDTNDINRIQVLMDGYATRITSLESEVKTLTEKDTARQKELAAIRRIVQKWYRELKAAWPDDRPMPMPSDEDADLLGITR